MVLSSQCYGKDKLSSIGMKNPLTGDNVAATKYGYSRIGLSSPDGHWTFGNDNIVNDDKPMPCSDADSKDITYLKTVFEFIESYPDAFDTSRIYAEGFSQNGMFSAYIGFCFPGKVLGVMQGGSGLALNGKEPFPPKMGAQCSRTSYQQFGKDCIDEDPCTTCQYWPIYPCYTKERPMIDCLVGYNNDNLGGNDVYMYQKLVDEGHDGRRMSFAPSEDGSIPGGHKAPKNKAHWYVGCFGITEPCSSECEISFSSCMASKDQTTAAKKVTAFSECILGSAELTGCTADCSPTYDMLIQSETPAEVSFSKGVFGAGTGESVEQPTSSLCKAEEQI